MVWLVIIGGLYVVLGGIAALYLVYCLISVAVIHAVKFWRGKF